MRGVLVNPATSTIRAEAGCTQADLSHAAHDFGLAVPLGVISSTGIGGLTLGGGMGYLTRKYGLTVGKLLEWYREVAPAQPEELSGLFAFLKVPPGPPFPEGLHGKTMCGIIWAYCGPLDVVEEAFRPVRKFRARRFELMGSMPYPALQSMFDAMYPPGLQWYWRGDFLGQIPDRAIDEHLKFGEQLPTLQSTMQLYPVDGAVSRVDRHETAFSYRDAKWSMVIVGVDPDPANADKITAWTKGYW